MRLLITFLSTLILSLVVVVDRPDLAIQPGKLSAGHRNLRRDCLRCHDLLQGAAPVHCLRCHNPAEIGRETAGRGATSGGARKVLFHASLTTTECMECHRVHASTRHGTRVTFRHDFLAAAVRGDCRSCHLRDMPADARHQRLAVGCAACHRTESWRGAAFDHTQAAASGLACVRCHQENRPTDALHREAGDGCATCHGTAQWRPARFDHARYFRFDANHPPHCRVCHAEGTSYAAYSCYGCHEHTPARIAAEHREEGIFDFASCARCHRSGDKEAAEGGHHGERERGEERDDD